MALQQVNRLHCQFVLYFYYWTKILYLRFNCEPRIDKSSISRKYFFQINGSHSNKRSWPLTAIFHYTIPDSAFGSPFKHRSYFTCIFYFYLKSFWQRKNFTLFIKLFQLEKYLQFKSFIISWIIWSSHNFGFFLISADN